MPYTQIGAFERVLERAVTLAPSGRVRPSAYLHRAVTHAFVEQHRFDEALAHAEKGMRLSEELEMPVDVGLCHLARASALKDADRMPDAAAALLEAITIFDASGATAYRARAAAVLAEVRLHQGDPATALELALGAGEGDPWTAGYANRVAGMAAARCGDQRRRGNLRRRPTSSPSRAAASSRGDLPGVGAAARLRGQPARGDRGLRPRAARREHGGARLIEARDRLDQQVLVGQEPPEKAHRLGDLEVLPGARIGVGRQAQQQLRALRRGVGRDQTGHAQRPCGFARPERGVLRLRCESRRLVVPPRAPIQVSELAQGLRPDPGTARCGWSIASASAPASPLRARTR